MNEMKDKIINFGRNYKKIEATRLFDVTNDKDTYILIYDKENNLYKILMSIVEIDNLFKNYKIKKEIELKNFIDKTFIIKNNKENPITKGDKH